MPTEYPSKQDLPKPVNTLQLGTLINLGKDHISEKLGHKYDHWQLSWFLCIIGKWE